MCDPRLAIGAQAYGAATSTVGAYYSAQAQKSSLKTQASIADTNARLAEISAQGELLKGQRAEQSVRLTTAKVKSSQRASMTANGIDLGSTTAVNVLDTTDIMGEIDANTAAANAVRSAWGYRTQGVNYTNDAITKRATAKGISPWMQAGTSLLTGAGSVAKDYYQLKKYGAFEG